ncbi:MAG: 1-acyl-sn-glycerol-3-phosphate acyltransferase [Candidatus Pseudothioglobus sp.]|jgi:1-acyl-sn-glycerol-3-phosphate acyltransferase
MKDIRPRCSTIAHYFGKLIFLISGWQVEGDAPMHRSMLIIAAPHTSNWDAVFLLGAAYSLRLRINWLVKNSLFVPVVRNLIRFFGAIPVERSRNTNMVQRLAEQILGSTGTALVVPPSGTRARTDYWKSGFYRIAMAADIPIVCGYLDYDKKVAGLGLSFFLTGDMTADMDRIRDFYASVAAKYPANKSRIRLREEDEKDGESGNNEKTLLETQGAQKRG